MAQLATCCDSQNRFGTLGLLPHRSLGGVSASGDASGRGYRRVGEAGARGVLSPSLRPGCEFAAADGGCDRGVLCGRRRMEVGDSDLGGGRGGVGGEPNGRYRMSNNDRVRDRVSKAYAEAVTTGSGCCGGGDCATTDKSPKGVAAKTAGYTEEELASLPAEAAVNSFGCGNPTAFAGVTEGEVVVDLGSGAGIDLLLAARKVGSTGKVIGIDMTDEMIDRARKAIQTAGADNVEVRKGFIENLPVDDSSVDLVISNCVINLSPDKPKVFCGDLTSASSRWPHVGLRHRGRRASLVATENPQCLQFLRWRRDQRGAVRRGSGERRAGRGGSARATALRGRADDQPRAVRSSGPPQNIRQDLPFDLGRAVLRPPARGYPGSGARASRCST